jgi:hypothetical protein
MILNRSDYLLQYRILIKYLHRIRSNYDIQQSYIHNRNSNYQTITKIIENSNKRNQCIEILSERLGDWIEIGRIAESYMYVKGLLVHNELNLCTILLLSQEDSRVIQYLESCFKLPITGELELMTQNYRHTHFTVNYARYVDLNSRIHEFGNPLYTKFMKSAIRWRYPELLWKMLREMPILPVMCGWHLDLIVCRYLVTPNTLTTDEINDRINLWQFFVKKHSRPHSNSNFYDNLIRNADINLLLKFWDVESMFVNTLLLIRIIRENQEMNPIVADLMTNSNRRWSGGLDLLQVYKVAIQHQSPIIPMMIEKFKRYPGYDQIVVDHALRTDDWLTLTTYYKGLSIDFLFIKAALYGSIEIVTQLHLRYLERKQVPPYNRVIKRLRRSQQSNSNTMIEFIRQLQTREY